ncbi:MAG: HAD family phosphatase [Pseudomonadota bacterium]
MTGLIFDCDGVLVDSEKMSCGAWLPVLRRRGVEATLEKIESFIGKSDRAVLEHFRARHPMPMPPGDEEILAEREHEYFAQARGRLKGFTNEREVLVELRRCGYRMAVASSGRPQKIRFNLEQAGILDLFEVTVSATEVVRGKPAPDLFLLAAKKLGIVGSRCAVVEDSTFGITAACLAGMHAIGFCSSQPDAALRSAGARRTIADYRDLPPLLVELGLGAS